MCAGSEIRRMMDHGHAVTACGLHVYLKSLYTYPRSAKITRRLYSRSEQLIVRAHPAKTIACDFGGVVCDCKICRGGCTYASGSTCAMNPRAMHACGFGNVWHAHSEYTRFFVACAIKTYLCLHTLSPQTRDSIMNSKINVVLDGHTMDPQNGCARTRKLCTCTQKGRDGYICSQNFVLFGHSKSAR